MNQKQRLILILFSFTIGMMSSVISLKSSFTGPKVDPFCSPPADLMNQWDIKEWKIYAIPRVGADEKIAIEDPMHHNMRDYKFAECFSYGIERVPDANNGNKSDYSVDRAVNHSTCSYGYSFEDPGSPVSFIAEVRGEIML
jgi:hypothetical protein